MSIVKKVVSFTLLLFGFSVFFAPGASASITFPVIGESYYTNDFDAPRSNGKHGATDIIANKLQPVVSATDGVITYVEYPQRSTQGYMVIVRSTAGNYYLYIHLNNDDKGTDNGTGGGMKAYAPDVMAGNPVKRGQLLGWLGDSGNAENTVPHLHFEIRDDSLDGPRINPYPLLKNESVKITKPANYPALPNEILPFGASFKREVNIARGNVTEDDKEYLIAGAGSEGSSPLVRIYDPSTRQKVAGFYALDKKLKNSVDVAAGDIDGDGKDEVITGVRGREYAKVAIYSYNTAENSFDKLKEFIAYGGASTSSTIPRVAAGDIDGDGKDEIITGTGVNSASLVRVFTAEGELVKSYRPISKTFQGGIDITAGNVGNLPSTNEIIVAPLTGGSSRTMIFDASQPGLSLSKIREFHAYGSSYRGGIRLSVGDVYINRPGFEIVTVPNEARSIYRVKSPTGETLQERTLLEDWWLGHYDVAASRDGSYSYSYATGGNRRGSIR